MAADLAKGLTEAADPETVFELGIELGKGSYGSVYKAKFLVGAFAGDVVAVKVIALEAGEDLEDVVAEIEILRECQDANIVKYYSSYMKDKNLWIAMEYCGAGSVGDLMNLRGKGLTESEIAFITRESLKGLAYLHRIKKIHRDIKGGNILVTGAGGVKLADFGVSGQLVNTFSKRNTFVGTPYWMAPEVIMETGYDGKADVWSMGITCIEMADQDPPCSNVHPMRVLFMIPRDPPPTLKTPDDWSDGFSAFVAACLVKDNEARPTASDLVDHDWLASATDPAVLLPLIEECRANAIVLQEQRAKAMADARARGAAAKAANAAGAQGGTVKKAGAAGDSSDDDGYNGDTMVVMDDGGYNGDTMVVMDDGGYNADTMVMVESAYDTTVYVESPVVHSNEEAAARAAPALRAAITSAPHLAANDSDMDSMGTSEFRPRASVVAEILARDAVIDVPFLSLAHVDTDVLISQEYGDVVDTLQEVSSGSIDVRPDALATNDMVCNLVKTLAHHRHRAAHVPMTDEEHALNRVVVRELTQTVQTIFKI